MGKTVIIVGAGIAGLGTAVALHRQGFRVRLCDQKPRLPSEDSGLLLSAKAMSVLKQYHLAHHLTQKGPLLKHLSYRNPAGDQLTGISLHRDHQGPVMALHKKALAETLLQALPKNTLQTGRKLLGFAQEDNWITAHFEGAHYLQADLLIGADGPQSTIRPLISGESDQTYAGHIYWTGLSPRADLVEGGTFFESSGQGHRFGATNIGGGKVYWFACINLPRHTWFDQRTQEELVLRFLRFHAPVAALIESTPRHLIHQTPCYHIHPPEKWSQGLVTLVGNAAHPMAGVLGESTCQGLEDGLVLANCLSGTSDIPSALKHYQQLRQPQITMIQRSAVRAGKLGQMEHPLACTLRNLAMRYTPRFSVQRHYNQILGLERTRASA